MQKLIPLQSVTVEKAVWKDGESNGRKWSKIGILTKELGEKWLGCFESNQNSKFLRAIQEGNTIEIIVTENGDFLNFRQPTYVDTIAQHVIALQGGASTDDYPRSEDEGGDEPNPDDIPF